MFTNHPILDSFYYICAQNAQCWTRTTKSDMEIQRYNRLKAAIKREQNEVHFNSAEWEQARPQVKIVLAEKERTGTWLSKQMAHCISTVSRWMTNKVHPSVEPLGFAACQSKNSTRLHATSTWM